MGEFESFFSSIWKEYPQRVCACWGRCQILFEQVKDTSQVPGDIAEVGVWRGGSARVLAEASKSTGKLIHLFDTFSGQPFRDEKVDIGPITHFGDTSPDIVAKYLESYPAVRIYPGIFPSTAGPVKDKNFSFVHIDADMYKSIWDASEFFAGRVSTGGVIVYDDYGYLEGAKKAVDRFYAGRTDFRQIVRHSSQYIVTKT